VNIKVGHAALSKADVLKVCRYKNLPVLEIADKDGAPDQRMQMVESGMLLPLRYGKRGQLMANALKVTDKCTVCTIHGIAEPILSKNRACLDTFRDDSRRVPIGPARSSARLQSDGHNRQAARSVSAAAW